MTKKPKLDADQLQRRVDDGYRKIEEDKVLGRDVQAWEEFWIKLLREYEEACEGVGIKPEPAEKG